MGDIILPFTINPRNLHPLVMVEVNGQKSPCSPLGWGESLLSAVQVDITQLRAVKNITRRVAQNTLLEYDLCLRAIRKDFALSTRAREIDRKEIIIDARQPSLCRAVANCQ